MDLKAHELKEHSKGQGKRGVQIEMDFTYNTQRQTAAAERQATEDRQRESNGQRNQDRVLDRMGDRSQSQSELRNEKDNRDTTMPRKTNKQKERDAQRNASGSGLVHSSSSSTTIAHPERLNMFEQLNNEQQALNPQQDINAQQYPQLSNSTRNLRVPLNFGSTLSDANTNNSNNSTKKLIPSPVSMNNTQSKKKKEPASSWMSKPPGLSQQLPQTITSITTDASLNDMINMHLDSNLKSIEQFDSLFKSYTSQLITSRELLEGFISMSNKDVQRVWTRLSAFHGGLIESDMLSAWNDLKAKAGSQSEDFSRLGKKPYTLNKIKPQKPNEQPLNDVFKILTINRAHSTPGKKMKKEKTEITDKRVDAYVPDQVSEYIPVPVIKAAREYAEERNPFEQEITMQTIPQKQLILNQEVKGGKTKYSQMMGSNSGDIQTVSSMKPQTLNSDFPSLPWTQKLDMNKMYGKPTKKKEEFDELFLDFDTGKKGKKGKKVLMKWG